MILIQRLLLIMTITAKLSTALIVVLLAACSGVAIDTDHDPSIDFSRYHSYYWKLLPVTGNPLMDRRIVNLVDKALRDKGWRRVPEPLAQTALAADVTTRQEQQVHAFHDHWGPGWHGWGWGGPMTSQSRVITYEMGTLVLDMYDVSTKNVIWRGTATDTLSKKPAKMKETLENGVWKMFEKFPPGQSGRSNRRLERYRHD